MNAQTSQPLIILGGNGPSGAYLAGHLAAAGISATFISRRPFTPPTGFTNLELDLNNPGEWKPPADAIVLSLLPLWVLQQLLPHLKGVRAIIATSSTSRFSKSASSEANERTISKKLTDAEAALEEWCSQNNVTWTILRPTLIYDGKSDRNITRMAHFIRRWRFLPIAIPSNGMRQPIHTDDVAKAIFKSIGNPAAANRAFNIAGGEVITYRTMAERVFAALNQTPYFITLPVPFMRWLFRILSLVGIVKEKSFGAAIFQRMNEDLIFETVDGLAALNYEPRPFKPVFSKT